MPADKPTELSRIKLKTWTRQLVPMISEHSAHSTPQPFGIRTWLWRYTCLLLLISMLWHRQAIFESKGDKLSSSAEWRIRTHQDLRHQIVSRLNARWQTDWAIEDQAKNLNSTARPYYNRAFSPLDCTAVWHSHLALAIYMFVVVNFDALAQPRDIRIEMRQVVFLCWMQDSNPSYIHTCLFMLISMLWNRQAIFESKGDRWPPLLNAGFEPIIHIYMFVVVNFDDLPQASDIRIERRQVVFLCWMQDSNPSGSQTPNRQQTECLLTNRLSFRGSS